MVLSFDSTFPLLADYDRPCTRRVRLRIAGEVSIFTTEGTEVTEVAQAILPGLFIGLIL